MVLILVMEPQFCVRYLAFICLKTFRINPIFYVSTTDTCVVSFFRKQRELEIHGGAVICLLTNWSFDRPNQHFQKWLKLSLQNWKIHPLQRKQKICMQILAVIYSIFVILYFFGKPSGDIYCKCKESWLWVLKNDKVPLVNLQSQPRKICELGIRIYLFIFEPSTAREYKGFCLCLWRYTQTKQRTQIKGL